MSPPGALPPLLLSEPAPAPGPAAPPPPLSLRERWVAACSRGGPRTRLPDLPKWSNMDAADKREYLYDLAVGIGYRGPYTDDALKELLEEGRYSVEHVVPRSHFNDPDDAIGVRDPNGWIAADRGANSARSNRPLVLWPRLNSAIALGHFRPRYEARARLARKWLYMRYQYAHELTERPPSLPQYAHENLMFAWLKLHPPTEQEMVMNERLHNKLGWSNPLLSRDKQTRDSFLDDLEFQRAVFPALAR